MQCKICRGEIHSFGSSFRVDKITSNQQSVGLSTWYKTVKDIVKGVPFLLSTLILSPNELPSLVSFLQTYNLQVINPRDQKKKRLLKMKQSCGLSSAKNVYPTVWRSIATIPVRKSWDPAMDIYNARKWVNADIAKIH